MPYKVFVAGEEALAADVNSYLMSQTVARFTNATQRTSQLTAPVLNQMSALDTNPGAIHYWNGTAWTELVGGVWTQYTPGVFGDSGATTVGNGSATGRYKVIGEKTLLIALRFQKGSSTVFNAGSVRLGLPAGLTANMAVPGLIFGVGSFYKATTVTVTPSLWFANTSSQLSIYAATTTSSATSLITNAHMATDGDAFGGTAILELA
jgi:hypothetical protein